MELITAIQEQDIAKVKKLIRSHPTYINEKDEFYNTPLHYAVWQGNLEIINLLINSKPAIDIQNAAGNTPLLMATIQNQRTIVNKLLGIGANPNLKNNFGYTSLHNAAAINNLDMMQDLVPHGGDIHAKTYSGMSLLHCVAFQVLKNYDIRLTKWLIEMGVDYLATTETGQSVLRAFSLDGSDGSYLTNLVSSIIDKDISLDADPE